MTGRLLTVGYPLARIGPDAVGGAEQIMTAVEAAAVAAGWRSTVVAPQGSRPAGTLHALPLPRPPYDEHAVAMARARTRDAVAELVNRQTFDIVHIHGVDFAHYLPPPGPPTLVTLHCPADWYDPGALSSRRPRTWFNTVSHGQHRDLVGIPSLLPPIENGVDLTQQNTEHRRLGFALVLSRIAPEKGIREALDAARTADMPLIIAGAVFPYPDHLRYLQSEVTPRVDRLRRLIGPVGRRGKARLLHSAACLLVTSSVAETSSLAAREAIASGTPVVGLRRGALGETVDHGRTGLLVEHTGDLPAAMAAAAHLSRETCRRVAADRFDADRMTRSYLDLYARLATGAIPHRSAS